MEAKSNRVEEAANELIAMLLDVEEETEDEDSDDNELSKKNKDEKVEETAESPNSDGVEGNENRPKTGGSIRPGSRASRLGSAVISPEAAAAKRKREMRDYLEEEAQELLSFFNHRNVDAIVRVTRTTLDAARKRVAASTAHHFIESEVTLQKKETTHVAPLFRADVTLQIPLVTMQPALDEIQQALNKAAQYVVQVIRFFLQLSSCLFPNSYHIYS